MLDILQDRDAMGLKTQARATHAPPERILQLLRLKVHLQDEVMILAKVCNERYQR